MENKENYFSADSIGLSEADFSKIISVFESFPVVEKVTLYGSRAKGNYRQYSDVDIVLDGAVIDLRNQQQVEIALDDLYLPYTFDVSVLSKISNNDLVAHIARVGIEIYKKNA